MNEKQVFLTVKDHSVSGEEFQLIYNSELDMLETHPAPSLENLDTYYNTEDYISHTDSNRNLFEKIYQSVRKISLKRKLKLISKYVSNEKSLLDIGCGTGDFLSEAIQSDWQVCGIEPNENARDIANKKTNNLVYNTDKLSTLNAGQFDVITLWHVLEHLPNLDAQISILKTLLKPTGTLIIAVPNFKSFDALHYKSYWAAFDAPRHLWHFSKTAIKKLFKKENMIVTDILPMVFDAYYVSLLSEKYKRGRMNPIFAFWIGLKSNLKAKRSKEYSSHIYVIKNQ